EFPGQGERLFGALGKGQILGAFLPARPAERAVDFEVEAGRRGEGGGPAVLFFEQGVKDVGGRHLGGALAPGVTTGGLEGPGDGGGQRRHGTPRGGAEATADSDQFTPPEQFCRRCQPVEPVRLLPRRWESARPRTFSASPCQRQG